MTTKTDNNQLQFRFQVAEDIGDKPDMEDAHFYIKTENGILAGVFDGHGGGWVAEYANLEFPKRFFDALKNNVGADTALTDSLKQIHKEVRQIAMLAKPAFPVEKMVELVKQGSTLEQVAELAKKKSTNNQKAELEKNSFTEEQKAALKEERFTTQHIAELEKEGFTYEQILKLSRGGSTAVIIYIDVKTNKIFTTTLGDSEAHLYQEKTQKDIKLSENPNWGVPDEYSRLVDQGCVKKNYIEVYLRTKPENVKHIRSRWKMGVNISRTLGDVVEKTIGHEPTIREHNLSKGDIIVLSSDGLTDLKKAEEIGPIIRQNREDAKRNEEKLSEIKQAIAKAPSALERPCENNQDIEATLVAWEKIYLLICLLFQTLIRRFEKNIAESLVASVETKLDNITALVIEVI